MATLTEELLHHNAASTLHALPENKALKQSWFGDIGKDDFQEAYQQLFKAITTQGVSRLLVDERNMMALSTKGRMWLVTKFARREGKPALQQLQRVAIIKARSVFAATLTKLIFKSLSGISTFEYVYFDDESQALTWLGAA